MFTGKDDVEKLLAAIDFIKAQKTPPPLYFRGELIYYTNQGGAPVPFHEDYIGKHRKKESPWAESARTLVDLRSL